MHKQISGIVPGLLYVFQMQVHGIHDWAEIIMGRTWILTIAEFEVQQG